MRHLRPAALLASIVMIIIWCARGVFAAEDNWPPQTTVTESKPPFDIEMRLSPGSNIDIATEMAKIRAKVASFGYPVLVRYLTSRDAQQSLVRLVIATVEDAYNPDEVIRVLTSPGKVEVCSDSGTVVLTNADFTLGNMVRKGDQFVVVGEMKPSGIEKVFQYYTKHRSFEELRTYVDGKEVARGLRWDADDLVEIVNIPVGDRSDALVLSAALNAAPLQSKVEIESLEFNRGELDDPVFPVEVVAEVADPKGKEVRDEIRKLVSRVSKVGGNDVRIFPIESPLCVVRVGFSGPMVVPWVAFDVVRYRGNVEVRDEKGTVIWRNNDFLSVKAQVLPSGPAIRAELTPEGAEKLKVVGVGSGEGGSGSLMVGIDGIVFARGVGCRAEGDAVLLTGVGDEEDARLLAAIMGSEPLAAMVFNPDLEISDEYSAFLLSQGYGQ